ncbi:MAG: DUF1194 domain-containing protein [Pseudomonadota bacterium]
MRTLRSYVAAIPCFVWFCTKALACDLALIMAVDVSGSVDQQEFATQMRGLSEGLRDPEVSNALIAGQAALMVVQWTGASRQDVLVPWSVIDGPEVLAVFAEDTENAQRRWRNFSTAIGEALQFSAAQFSDAPACTRRVIDISGDGSSNEGVDPKDVRDLLGQLGIVVNALVIEGAEENIIEYFLQNVISGNGSFVITANSYNEYPEKMRLKLLREIAKQVASNSE